MSSLLLSAQGQSRPESHWYRSERISVTLRNSSAKTTPGSSPTRLRGGRPDPEALGVRVRVVPYRLAVESTDDGGSGCLDRGGGRLHRCGRQATDGVRAEIERTGPYTLGPRKLVSRLTELQREVLNAAAAVSRSNSGPNSSSTCRRVSGLSAG